MRGALAQDNEGFVNFVIGKMSTDQSLKSQQQKLVKISVRHFCPGASEGETLLEVPKPGEILQISCEVRIISFNQVPPEARRTETIASFRST